MSEQSLVELIEEHLSAENKILPVFSRVALKIHEMLDSEDYDGDELAAVIQQDQALTTLTLRVANSAFYAGLHPVRTVKEAVVRLGVNSLKSTLQLSTQKTLYTTKVRQFLPWIDAMWRHALCVAIASKWLAQNLGYNSLAEEAFLAGLLHDIGKLVQLKAIEDLLISKTLAGKISLNLIQEIMIDLHTAHGCIYLKKQNIPDVYWLVAMRHHELKVTGENAVLNLVRLGNKATHKLDPSQDDQRDVMLSTTPEAINLMARDIVLAELLVNLEDEMQQLNSVL